jgi:OmcA/MtrC family decaheme c-type cytochrome
MEACGSCHDDVYFSVKPDPAKLYQIVAHRGGVMTDNAACASCHTAGTTIDAADIGSAHNFPARLKAAAAKFQLNILDVAPTGPGSTPVVTFSVTDPTNGNKPYNLKADAPFTAGSNSTLHVDLSWTKTGIADIGNDGSEPDYAQPVGIDALAAAVAGIAAGTYTVSSPVAVPATLGGTLHVSIYGHPAGDVTTAGTFADKLSVRSVFKDFAITGSAIARRQVVDIAKCNVCHGLLSAHDNDRTDELQTCAACHNPNATDAMQRPRIAGFLSIGSDGKPEEAIDLKTMLHAIHAGQTANGGFRTIGITIYREDGSPKDFSKVVYPGKLRNCAGCHLGTSYQLTGLWDASTRNGILGTTISSGTLANDPADNLRITPIAAVCSSCHDSAVAKAHMLTPISGANFFSAQAAINTIVEHCPACHGPGGVKDVQAVHSVK